MKFVLKLQAMLSNKSISILVFSLLFITNCMSMQNDHEVYKANYENAFALFLFVNTTIPLTYQSQSIVSLKSDMKSIDVNGKACNWQLTISSVFFYNLPISIETKFGNAGLIKTHSNAVKENNIKYLYDVKVDEEITSILYFFRRNCYIVSAKGII